MRYLIWCVHHDVNEQEYADYEEKLEELEMRELKKEQDAMVQFRHTHTHTSTQKYFNRTEFRLTFYNL